MTQQMEFGLMSNLYISCVDGKMSGI